ncbi:MAG: hypothetical protein ACE5OW_06385 [Candidatus Bathyarchaeia archaeon]
MRKLASLELLQNGVHEFNLLPETRPILPHPMDEVIKSEVFLSAFQIALEDPLLLGCENVLPHNIHYKYILNNDIFKYYIVAMNRCRVCASEAGAKNSAEVKGKGNANR